MTLKGALRLAASGAIFVATLAAFQMPWRVYLSMEPYDDIPLPPDAAVTQPGDLLVLGNHRLLCFFSEFV